MKTRKEFLEAVMKMANLRDLKQADDVARAVIALTKGIIGRELSQQIELLAEVGRLFGISTSALSKILQRSPQGGND